MYGLTSQAIYKMYDSVDIKSNNANDAITHNVTTLQHHFEFEDKPTMHDPSDTVQKHVQLTEIRIRQLLGMSHHRIIEPYIMNAFVDCMHIT